MHRGWFFPMSLAWDQFQLDLIMRLTASWFGLVGPLPSLLRPRLFPNTICSLELITCPSPLFLLDIIRYLIVLCSFRTWLKVPLYRISLLLCAAVSSCPSRFTSLKHPWALQAEHSRISVQISPTSVLF